VWWRVCVCVVEGVCVCWCRLNVPDVEVEGFSFSTSLTNSLWKSATLRLLPGPMGLLLLCCLILTERYSFTND
jgi:hypothetical protein